jgi:hypothetical protein
MSQSLAASGRTTLRGSTFTSDFLFSWFLSARAAALCIPIREETRDSIAALTAVSMGFKERQPGMRRF